MAAGTYAGTGYHDIDFGGMNLVLMSEDGPEVTILDGSNTYRISHAGTSEWRTTRIQGFTFRNGQRQESWGLTDMVKITSSAWVNFDNMIFEGGAASNGAAVHIKDGQAVFTDCVFRNNAASNKGAVYVEVGIGRFNNCLFEQNTANEGAAIYSQRGTTVIDNCTFRNNTGGTIFTYWNSGSTITNCIIWGTKVGMGTKRCETITCSLIFDNEGGDVSPCVDLSAGGNFNRDPGFCDPEGADYRIAANSPACRDIPDPVG